MKKTKKLTLILAGINAFLCMALLLTSLLYTAGFEVVELPLVTRIFLEVLLLACPICGLGLSILVGFIHFGKYEGDGSEDYDDEGK